MCVEYIVAVIDCSYLSKHHQQPRVVVSYDYQLITSKIVMKLLCAWTALQPMLLVPMLMSVRCGANKAKQSQRRADSVQELWHLYAKAGRFACQRRTPSSSSSSSSSTCQRSQALDDVCQETTHQLTGTYINARWLIMILQTEPRHMIHQSIRKKWRFERYELAVSGSGGAARRGAEKAGVDGRHTRKLGVYRTRNLANPAICYACLWCSPAHVWVGWEQIHVPQNIHVSAKQRH